MQAYQAADQSQYGNDQGVTDQTVGCQGDLNRGDRDSEKGPQQAATGDEDTDEPQVKMSDAEVLGEGINGLDVDAMWRSGRTPVLSLVKTVQARQEHQEVNAVCGPPVNVAVDDMMWSLPPGYPDKGKVRSPTPRARRASKTHRETDDGRPDGSNSVSGGYYGDDPEFGEFL